MSTVRVSQGWRVVIPAEMRKKLKLHQGDELICDERNGELVFASKKARIQRVHQLFQQMRPNSGRTNIVDEFLAERRTEAAQEETETQKYLKRMGDKHGKPPTGT